MTQLYLRHLSAQIETDQDDILIPNELKIEIDLLKNKTSLSAQGKIVFYNLAETTKSRIRESGNRIRIFGGYRGFISLLHDGQIWYTQTEVEGVNRKFILYLTATSFNSTQATFSKSYQGQTQLRTIINDALLTYDIPFGQDILNVVPDQTVNNFIFNGRTEVLLNQLLNPFKIQVFEQNNQLFLSEVGKPLSGQEDNVFELNATSGMIKTPIPTTEGIEVTSLLNPRLQAGQIIKIEDEVLQQLDQRSPLAQQRLTSASGFYQIIQVNFRGSNWDTDFEAVLQCVAYNENSTINS